MSRGFNATDGSGTTDKITTAYSMATPLTISAAAWVYPRAAVAGIGRVFQADAGSLCNVTVQPTTVKIAFGYVFSTTTGQWEAPALTTGAWTHVAVVYDANSTSNVPTIYYNGVSQSLTTLSTPAGAAVTTSGTWSIGNRASDSARCLDGRLAELAWWDVLLTAAEVAALAKGYTPDQIRPASLLDYYPLVRDNISRMNAAPTLTGTAVQPHPRIIMPHRRGIRTFTSAAGSYTLTAAAGIFTETGQDAGLLAARTIAGAAGAFTETGQDAGLYVGRVVTGETGAFTFTGNDATLTYTPAGAYTLTADKGTFTETGQDAGLLATRLITGEAGAFAETGQDAGLYAGRVVTGDAGSFTETGQDAGLIVARRIAGDAGAFVETGQDASLIYSASGGYTLTAARGTFTFAGIDAIPSPFVALPNRRRIGRARMNAASATIGSTVARPINARIGD